MKTNNEIQISEDMIICVYLYAQKGKWLIFYNTLVFLMKLKEMIESRDEYKNKVMHCIINYFFLRFNKHLIILYFI